MNSSVNVGGLKAAAKRTAFGDVSNTKNLQPNNEAAIAGKKPGLEGTDACRERNPVPPLRPAQRPLSVSGLKAIINAVPTNIASHATAAPKQTQPDIQAVVPRKALTKRSTIIFKDKAVAERDQSTVAAHEASNWPAVAPVHQSLVPRHAKSQPYIRAEQPAIRRTKSKHMDKFVEEDEQQEVETPAFSDEVTGAHSDPIYQDGGDGNLSDAQDPADENDDSGVKLSLPVDKEQVAEQPTQNNETNVEASFAEPEEYWEDDDDEEYDDEGYTTARSRGENTTGGVTTILFPQVTARVRKELAAAKLIVESTRLAEDIDEEFWDTSMVAEYGDEIFQYMRELEVSEFYYRAIRLHTLVPFANRVNLLDQDASKCELHG
jgi:G2/mitotic-specific cyclin 3/4